MKHRLSLILLSLTLCGQIWAQNISVKGRVTDSSNTPLPGAGVLVPGTSTGVMTDFDGYYTITVDANAVLEYSYIGYQSQTVNVAGRSSIDVILADSENFLEETVVIGYGTQKKVNVTGSVATTDYTQIAKSRPITSTAAALVGMNAGVMVRQTSSNPGSEDVTIRIRGIGTLNDSAPLVIIDGFEGSIGNVNPDDIASISILKDAASCAIYGNRGANGVVLVTTKGGNDKARNTISYSGQMAINEPANKFSLVSNYADYMEIMNESAENVGASSIYSQAMIDLWREKSLDPYGTADSGYPNYVAYPNTDWVDAMFNRNIYQKHNISASGASGGIKYLMSASYMDNPGIVDNTGYKRIQLRANVSSQVTDWMEIGMKLWGYKGIREINDFEGASGYMSRATPGIYPYYDGKFGWMENPEQSSNSRNNLYFFNRLGGSSKSIYANAAIFTNIKLPFGIKYHASFNYTHSTGDYMKYVNLGGAYSFSRGQEAYTYNNLANRYTEIQNSNTAHWTFQTNLSWNKTIASKHDIGVLAGFEALYHNVGKNSARRKNASSEFLHEIKTMSEMVLIDGNHSDYAAASVFGRATYAYDSRYLLEVNLRYDGSSRFSPQARWGLFPSVSAGWRISQEPWMKGSGIDNLKLRASWGQLGNNSIGDYDYLSTYTAGAVYYPIGNNQVSGVLPTLSNDALEWETTTSYNVGLELGILNNRLTLETDLYRKDTDGILYQAPLFATVGTKAAPFQNLCGVRNIGAEITLGWKDTIGDFQYNVSANFTRNKNVVSKYKGALEAGWVVNADGSRSYVSNIGDVSTGTSQRVLEGHIINEWYLAPVYSGNGSHFFADGSVNPAGGPRDGMIRTPDDMAWLEAMIGAGAEFLPNKTVAKDKIWYGDLIYSDLNGDGIYGGTDDYQFMGKGVTPQFYYGFNFDAAYKGIDFSVALSGSGGNAIYWRHGGYNAYGTRADLSLPSELAYDHYFYDPENPDDARTNLNSKHGRLTLNYGSEQSGAGVNSTHFFYDLDFLRVKNLTLGYSFPEKWMKKISLSNLRVYFSGENLFTFTKFPGMDPEFNSTTNYYAMLRQYTFGISIKF